MGTLRCDICLAEETQVSISPLLPPLLHKHLGILIFGELLSCGGCNQLLNMWDKFSQRATHNLAISHPSAQTSLQAQIEKVSLMTAKLRQVSWGMDTSNTGLESQENTSNPVCDESPPSPVTTMNMLQIKQEVLGCTDVGNIKIEQEDIEDETSMADEFAENESTENKLFLPCSMIKEGESNALTPEEIQQSEHPCPQCPRTFMHEEVLHTHMKLRHNKEAPVNDDVTPCGKIKDMVICPKCNIKFSCNQYLLYHIMEYHTKKEGMQYICIFCSHTLKTRSSLMHHIRKHFGSTLYLKCDFCPKHLCSKLGLENHIKHQHNFQPSTQEIKRFKFDTQQFNYMCPLCYKGLSSKTNLEIHIRVCKDNPKIHIKQEIPDSDVVDVNNVLKFTCEFCYRVLTSEEKLRHHFYRCHHERSPRESTDFCLSAKDCVSFSCEFCQAELISKVLLEYHVQRWHLNPESSENYENPHTSKRSSAKQCKYCSRVFSSNQMLQYHMQRNHRDIVTRDQAALASKKRKNPLNYKCSFCNRTICSKQGLQKHILTYHSGSNQNSKFPCTICSNGFHTKVGLAHHMRHHPKIISNNGSDVKHTDKRRTPRSGTNKLENNVRSVNTETNKPFNLKLKFSKGTGNFSCQFTDGSTEQANFSALADLLDDVSHENFINSNLYCNEPDLKPFTCNFCYKILYSKYAMENHVKQCHVQQ